MAISNWRYRKLAEVPNLPVYHAEDLIDHLPLRRIRHGHSALKRLAVKLSKICNDLRLLSSRPARWPENQPARTAGGSSIMPAKVNPVVPEVVNQVCFKVIGNDTTVTMASEAGQLQLNVMEP
jgi:aspartate ammonia-lyase